MAGTGCSGQFLVGINIFWSFWKASGRLSRTLQFAIIKFSLRAIASQHRLIQVDRTNAQLVTHDCKVQECHVTCCWCPIRTHHHIPIEPLFAILQGIFPIPVGHQAAGGPAVRLRHPSGGSDRCQPLPDRHHGVTPVEPDGILETILIHSTFISYPSSTATSQCPALASLLPRMKAPAYRLVLADHWCIPLQTAALVQERCAKGYRGSWGAKPRLQEQ